MPRMITTTEELQAVCARFQAFPFITVDTEFLREYTYYPKLCLIQIASPEEAFCVDPLAPEIDLSPLFELMRNKNIVKVFHSARQDLEIFYTLMHEVPTPIFDTQIGAMVLGFGESVSYQNLVQKVLHINLDKGMRITDWSKRPLKEAQIAYALRDVTHLRDIYLIFKKRLEEQGRLEWIREEVAHLEDKNTYCPDDSTIAKKLKYPVHSLPSKRVFQDIYLWREHIARANNQPRRQVLKDEIMADLALVRPKTREDLATLRSLTPNFLKNDKADIVLEIIQKALLKENADFPLPDETSLELTSGDTNLLEMLRLLLTLIATQEAVAPRLIATNDELSLYIKNNDTSIRFMTGWRYQIFGKLAQEIKEGKIAFAFNPKQKKIVFQKLD